MTFVSRIVAAAVLLTACAGPAFAGEPGKTKLQPLYGHPQTKVEVQKHSYVQQGGHSYTYTTSKSDALNLKEYKRLQDNPPPQPKIVYRAVTPQPYHSNTHTTYTYTQPPVTCGDFYSYTHTAAGCVAPPPPPPPQPYRCVQPHTNGYTGQPCGTHYTKYAPEPIQPQHPPVYMKVESCGDKVIRRLKNTPEGQRQYSVCYSDLLHLPESQLNMALLDRMETASGKACRDISRSYSLSAKRNCVEDTLVNAVYEANLPGLVDAYYIRTGKLRPKVHVGQPIMN